MAKAIEMVQSGQNPQILFENLCRTQGLDVGQMRGFFNSMGFRI